MLPHLHHAAAPTSSRLARWGCNTSKAVVRAKSSISVKDQITDSPVAKELEKAGVWGPTKRGPKSSAKNHGVEMQAQDARRVNIVSEKLCDDIIERLRSSLERHRGCDLIDINPGSSLWSRALHDAVQPRQHLMLDGDAKRYKSLREEVMGDRKVEVIPKSGLIWEELNKVLTKNIEPHHQTVERGEQPHKNDQLLITANISTFPKRSIWHFPDLASPILYQYMTSIRTSSVFQKYGSVRMLIWTDDHTKHRVLPRSILGRKRQSFEAELSCEYIHEVAGCDTVDGEASRDLSRRDQWINYESAANAMRQMEQNDLTTPAGRETHLMKIIRDDPSLLKGPLAGERPPAFDRPYQAELEEMRNGEPPPISSTENRRLYQLGFRERRADRDGNIFLELLQKHDVMQSKSQKTLKFKEQDRVLEKRLDSFTKNLRNDYLLARDSYHLFRHQPGLLWDRRTYEPLTVSKEEFYPNKPACLLDIQPKAMDPLLRQHGPQSSRSGDYAAILLKGLFRNPAHPVYPGHLDALWPGFAEMASRSCPSLWDPKQGGSGSTGHGRITVRAMNERHFIELLDAWMKWPFRPEYLHLLGRTLEMDEPVEM